VSQQFVLLGAENGRKKRRAKVYPARGHPTRDQAPSVDTTQNRGRTIRPPKANTEPAESQPIIVETSSLLRGIVIVFLLPNPARYPIVSADFIHKVWGEGGGISAYRPWIAVVSCNEPARDGHYRRPFMHEVAKNDLKANRG
jgi:hypothetical protein